MNARSKICYRKVRKEDLFKIFKQLEMVTKSINSPDNLRLTRSDFEIACFGDPSICGCFVAENVHKNIIAFAIYFHRYSAWTGRSYCIEFLYVEKDNEIHDLLLVEQLIKKVANEARENNIKEIEFYFSKWNPFKGVYKKLGAVEVAENSEVFRFYEDKIKILAK